MKRRAALSLLASSPVLFSCKSGTANAGGRDAPLVKTPGLVRSAEPLGFQWKTLDPFLFCVHHDDHYPAGNADLGPHASLSGRNLGSDFVLKDGYRMYHGQVVPGFPEHPHRGFETVTVVRRGLVDHSDSLGAAARYGGGDVQWLTAGGGIVHAEMFPLLSEANENPLELFQIWMNLPAVDKLVPAHFSMLWNETIPRRMVLDSNGKATELRVVAGRFGDATAPSPPPKSWAAHRDSDVAIWTIKMPAEARFVLPPAEPGTNRMLYYFAGRDARVGGETYPSSRGLELRPDLSAPIENGVEESEFLLLQARPIGEPVVQQGPFVMNTRDEIQKAYTDYRATGFGGWPWKRSDPVHAHEPRFARHADGRVERAG